MDIHSRQHRNRPIVMPSRSSHGRMQFVGFGLALPPKRKNLSKAERSKTIHDAEELVRIMGNNSDPALGRERGNKDVLQLTPTTSTTSNKNRLKRDKPWRAGHTTSVEVVSSCSLEKECTKEVPGDPFPQKPRHVDERFADLGPWNESLGHVDDGSVRSEQSDKQQKYSELVVTLEDTIEQLKRGHVAELKRVNDEHAKALHSALEALEQAQLSARVKLSSLERKLVDTSQAEVKRKEEEARKKLKLDIIENQLAAVELDRRMEVASLQRKLLHAEGRVQELHEKLSLMVSQEECEQRIQSCLEECEEKRRISETILRESLTATSRKDYDRIAENLVSLQKENDILRKENEVLLNKEMAAEMVNPSRQVLLLQNLDMAAKIKNLEEESVYSEARHMETLEQARTEMESLTNELECLRDGRLELLRKIDELSSNQHMNLVVEPSETHEKTQKIGELWDRLDVTEKQLEERHSLLARLQQDNDVLTDQLLKAQTSDAANKGLDEHIRTLETKLASTTVELDEAKSTLAAKLLENESLCQEMEQLQASTKEHATSLKSECVKREIMLSDMASNVKVLEKLLAETKRNLDRAEDRSFLCDRLTKLLESRDEELRELEAEHDRIKHDFQDATQREASLKEKLQEATEAHRNQVDELEAEICQCNTRISELHQQLSNLFPLSQEVGRVKMALHDAMEGLQQSELRNQSLSDQIEKLEHELSTANAKVLEIEKQLEQANQTKDETSTQLSYLESAQAKEQEILSEELRESETTIACLMEELELLRSIVPELESTEAALENSTAQCLALKTAMKAMQDQKDEELVVLQGQLVDSTQEIRELRLQLLPMTKELQHASRELEETQRQLKELEDGQDGGALDKIQLFEEEIAALRRELEDSTVALEFSERQLVLIRQETQVEVDEIKCNLTRSTETISKLQAEVKLLKPKVQLYERKQQECESLSADLDAKDKQINMCRLQLQDMEEERNYSRARIAELDDLYHQNGTTHSVLEDKAHELAQLKAERDTLKQKLNVVVAMVTALEEDNRQKKQLVHEMMSRSADAGGLSTEALIESLQKDLERTLKRCADLSLQLAESHFKIDQVTDELRRTKKSSYPNDTSSKRAFRRSGSYESPSRSRSATRRSTITSMFANSLNAMDESLRGVAGIGTNDKVQSTITNTKFTNTF
jgi:chromosome segregation ATPase